MKLSQRNLEDELTRSYVGKRSFIHRFIRYWGTTTVNGVEVMSYLRYYWPTMSSNTESVLKLLGIYKEVANQNPSGLSNAYLFINQEKANTLNMTREILVNALNEVDLTTEELGTIIISPFRTHNSIPGINTPDDQKSNLIDELVTKYDYLWDISVITSSLDGDGIRDTLLRYALRSGSGLTVNIVDVGLSYSEDVYGNGWTVSTQTLKKSYTLTLKVEDTLITDTTGIVDLIMADLEVVFRSPLEKRYKDNIITTQGALSKVYNNPEVLDENDEDYSYSYGIPQAGPENPALWEYSNRRYYLRVDALKGPNSLSLDSSMDLIKAALDSGYTKKKAKWYKRVLAFAVFVAAVWLAPATGGSSWTAIAAMSASEAVIAAGFAITMGALAVSVLQAGQTMWGDETGAAATGAFSKSISPITTLASIVTMFNAIYNFATNLTTKGATAALAETGKSTSKEVVAEAVKSASTASLIGYAIKGAGVVIKEQAKGFVSNLITGSLSTKAKALIQGTNIAMKLKARNQLKDISKLQSELANQQEILEEDPRTDLANRMLMNSMFNPVQEDHTAFDVEQQYSPQRKGMSMGNIQKSRYVMNPGKYDYHIKKNESKNNV